MQHCEYGFTVNVPLEVALSDVFLMATHYDGQAARSRSRLSAARRGRRNGRTALGRRSLLLEGWQVLRGLELMTADRPGFWNRPAIHDGQCLERRTVWLVTQNLPGAINLREVFINLGITGRLRFRRLIQQAAQPGRAFNWPAATNRQPKLTSWATNCRAAAHPPVDSLPGYCSARPLWLRAE